MGITHRAMPQIGLGTYRLEGQSAYQTVLTAIELGFRHIDTAQFYGNEREVGQAVKDSGVSRSELFITTKVWWDKLRPNDFIRSVESSLMRLGLDYVDLLLVHWPSPNNQVPMAEYLAALKQAKLKGFTLEIGVSNFTIAQLKQAQAILAPEVLYTNQVEVHPYHGNHMLIEYCHQHQIHVTGYMPLARGKVLAEPVIVDLAKKYQRTESQIVIAWCLLNGITTIPSSSKRAHLADNLAAMDLALSPADVAKINDLNRNQKMTNPDFSPAWDKDVLESLDESSQMDCA
ncbi:MULTISPECIES: 2,5-didehydrogluconate reductase DkgB [unclassified Vibrio]|uniref:2,5-didehydrogluconate reductase DkgB n=1 Tax=Vibrio sp. HB236076 TaxID=3232307 RepID=A0AB39HJ86_9VIBR|nr:2,5-didehydrogluconate reductase DkgB [Vibrio sp. HB161653]MDP5253069.1 2,5-didehydrogluconate reductase DkgB [Vibrio sp. HB161653]